MHTQQRLELQFKWGPCHHGLVCPQIADGSDCLQIWRLTVNILNTQSRTETNDSLTAFGSGQM
jgi:hypothetical protein